VTMIQDRMPSFELYQPTRLADAFPLLERFGKDGWKLAGGNDSLSWFKEGTKRPRAVIDLAGIEGLSGVRETADGVEIGAMTTLSAIEKDPLIRQRFRFLSEAAGAVASPQIRNSGTLGGNVADQPALNHLLLRRVYLLPKQWHTLTMELPAGPLQTPVVLHYANEIPWNRKTRWGLLSDTVMLWHEFNDHFVLQHKGASLHL